MTIKEITDGLKFTVAMFLFDPDTGETYVEPRNDMDKTTIDACKGAIELLEQTRWIPVNERTPEDRRTVLVTAYWHETYQVMMGSYYGDGLWWCVPYNNCGKHMQKLNPKAWMPLPSGYQGD